MTETEAIRSAIAHAKDNGADGVDYDKATATHWTLESFDAFVAGNEECRPPDKVVKRLREGFERSHWTIHIPFIIPEGEVWCPSSLIYHVYDDNGEVEEFRAI